MVDHTVKPIVRGDESEIAAAREQFRGAIDLIAGKWKLEILWLLNQRKHRFNELRRAIPGITQHMLTAKLRELEAAKLIKRTIFPEVPPRVEYEINAAAARALRPVYAALLKWARQIKTTQQSVD